MAARVSSSTLTLAGHWLNTAVVEQALDNPRGVRGQAVSGCSAPALRLQYRPSGDVDHPLGGGFNIVFRSVIADANALHTHSALNGGGDPRHRIRGKQCQTVRRAALINSSTVVEAVNYPASWLKDSPVFPSPTGTDGSAFPSAFSYTLRWTDRCG